LKNRRIEENMSRRLTIILAATAAAIVLLAGTYLWLTRTLPVLTVATWSGAYGRAQANALFHPFGEAKSYDVRIALYDGGLTELQQMVGHARYDWDVVDLELPDAIAACRLGLLEHVDTASLPPGADGAPAAKDFVANAVGPCWVGSVVYSQVIAFAPGRFAGAQPRTAADFFDLKRFPGPRALRKSSAKFNMELALLADGMAPGDVYGALLTPVGIDRALTKLGALKGSLIWWDNSADAVAMLHDGRAAFATTLDGDVYDAAQHHQPVGVIWDRQLYELDVFGVPKGDPRKDVAMDFVRFATTSQSLAGVAAWVPYGPARRSALALVGKNPELGTDMTPFLPTTPANFATAFAIDDEWWQLHGPDIEPRWQVWLAAQ
jgi:putative spermidine/putrescine transport system substrate-binding protein